MFYAFQYWNTIFTSLNMWKGSGVNVYSFTTLSAGRTEVVGNLSAYHKQEIKRTGAGQYDLFFDNAYFKDFTTTVTGRLAVAKIMGGSTSSSTAEGEKRFRVMRATFGDNVFLIPVVKGNQMGFYNTLDGQMFLAEQACLSHGKEIGAPYTKEVEYLESTGTQWIDTGYVPNNSSGFKINVSSSTTGGNHIPFGHRQDSGNTRWWINFSSTLEMSWNTWTSVSSYSANRWYEIEFNWLNSRNGKIDGVQKYTISSTLATHTGTAKMFQAGQGDSSVVNPFSGKISHVLVSEGGNIVRDFIPVRFMNENGQQEGAMYDKVSKQLFRNKGTGSFTIGPDKI